MKTMSWQRYLLGISLLPALVAWPEPSQAVSRVVAENDDFQVISKMVDGFPQISVVEHRSGVHAPLYQTRKPGLFLSYAIPWTIKSPQKTISGFFIAYEYGTGSSNLLTIVGPKTDGKWGELLHVDTQGAFMYRPQFVDIVGDGIVDVIAISNLQVDKAKPGMGIDLSASEIQVWRWSLKTNRYYLAKKTTYNRRFQVPRER